MSHDFHDAPAHQDDRHGIAIPPATLLAWVDEARVALQATADTIADSLRAAPLAHADESGLRVQGKLHWLHVAPNDSHTWYGVYAKRGMEAIAAQAILPQRLGILLHDCWAPYRQLAGTNALCNAHLLRELLYVEELTGERWPAKMSELLLRTNELCEAARRKNIALGAADVPALRTFHDAILSEGERCHPARLKPSGKPGRIKQFVAFNLLLRLRRNADAVLLFVSDPAVPFTNNLGERAFHMPKVKQKSPTRSALCWAHKTSASSAPASTRYANRVIACSPS